MEMFSGMPQLLEPSAPRSKQSPGSGSQQYTFMQVFPNGPCKGLQKPFHTKGFSVQNQNRWARLGKNDLQPS